MTQTEYKLSKPSTFPITIFVLEFITFLLILHSHTKVLKTYSL